MQARAIEATEQSFTTWYNPLKVPQRVQIITDNPRKPDLYTIPPGGERPIPSKYDSAIQVVHGNNVIMGGLAPQLINKSLPEDQRPKLHGSLDSEKQAREAEEAAAAAIELARTRAEDAAMIAAVRVDKQAKQRADIASRGKPPTS